MWILQLNPQTPRYTLLTSEEKGATHHPPTMSTEIAASEVFVRQPYEEPPPAAAALDEYNNAAMEAAEMAAFEKGRMQVKRTPATPIAQC